MKYLLTALLAFTLIACQNNPSQNQNAETQSADSTEVVVVSLADVLPPLEDELHVVKSNQESVIELESGVRVHIPRDAFVDANGNPITGSVTLKIQDMTSMAAILKSGIRMDATMENGERGIFQTAGMISIEADQLEIAPGKSIAIDFPAESTDETFPLWKLNEETNEWEKVAETTEVSTNSGITPQTQSEDSINGTSTFDNNFSISMSCDINIDHIGWHPPAPVEYNANYNNQITRNFKGIHHSRLELRDVEPLYFQALNRTSMENYNKMPSTNIKLRIGTTNNTYELYSYDKEKDEILIAQVTWSYVPQQTAHAQAYVEAIEEYKAIYEPLELLKNHIRAERQYGYDDDNYKSLYTRSKSDIEGLMNLQHRATAIKWLNLIDSLRSCRLEVVRQDQRLSTQSFDPSASVVNKVLSFRRVQISSFGIYNCDRFWREPSQNFTLAFSSGTEKVELKLIKLIDMEDKSITELTMFGSKSSYDLGIDRTYYLVGVSKEGDPYLAKMNTQELKTGETNTIQIQKASTEEEIETFLAEMT